VIDAVLWDNDGVLVDTESVFFHLTRELFAAAGADLSPRLWMKSYLGEGRSSREIAAALGIPSEKAERMLEVRNDVFRQRVEERVRICPGIPEALAALKGRVRQALVTGSPRDQLLLVHRSTGLLPFFDYVVTSEDAPRPKPAPDLYLTALERLGLPADRCLAVEDSARGVAAATAAGVRCVLVPHELTDREGCAGAWRVEPEIGRFVDLVKELSSSSAPA
jgi:HAD superfamily hydrolase (TIGR01509 family)